MSDNTDKKNRDIRLYLRVLRYQSGDERAFNELYNLYSDKTLRYLKTLLADEIAWDIQQEVWITVYKQIADLMNPAGFRSWLFRITRRKAMDQFRYERKRLKLNEKVKNELEKNSQMRAGMFLEAKLDIDIQSILDSLPTSQREVLILKYWEGMSYEEIALIIGCPLGTVRSRIYHAKKQIKDLIDLSDLNE